MLMNDSTGHWILQTTATNTSKKNKGMTPSTIVLGIICSSAPITPPCRSKRCTRAQVEQMQRKIASIQAASWHDSHEKGWKTKAPHNHHFLSFLCHSADATPAGEMAAPSEEAAMRFCFMSRQRNRTIFFTLAKQLKLACHIYRANPFIQPQRGIGTTLKACSAHGMSWWLSWHFCAKTTRLLNNTGCFEKVRQIGRNRQCVCSRWVAYLSWLKLRSSRRAKWP